MRPSGGEEERMEIKHNRDTPSVKKRKRRMKSANALGGQDNAEDAFEFVIVSLDNKQWQFKAGSAEDRYEWVAAIEQQILSSLQGNESSKSKGSTGGHLSDQATITRIRGNTRCLDCNNLKSGEGPMYRCQGVDKYVLTDHNAFQT